MWKSVAKAVMSEGVPVFGLAGTKMEAARVELWAEMYADGMLVIDRIKE